MLSMLPVPKVADSRDTINLPMAGMTVVILVTDIC